MRWIFIIALLAAALAARADGFAYGKGFQMLHETDQLAVIDLDEEKADVSMYIAIDGIPAGETITYVLPFWYRPDGFAMEEMTSAGYREGFVKPAHGKVLRMNRLAAGNASRYTLAAASCFGLGYIGPFVTFFVNPSVMSSSSRSPQAYAVHETTHARAELYNVQAKDLRQLVAQAGLPAEYAEPLMKYHTEHFAVMRLTGPDPGDTPAEGTVPGKPGGVCYRFRHAIPPEKHGEYVYPLGTGAAWPQPILLTEVYITCPDAFSLQVNAPRVGKDTHANILYNRLNEISGYNDLPADLRKQYLAEKTWLEGDNSHRGMTEQQFMAPMTTSILQREMQAPAAWHIAYLNSNPGEDIRIHLAPRMTPWRLAIANTFIDLYLPFLSAGLFMLISWMISLLAIIRPRWVRAGRPESLASLTWNCMVIASCEVTLATLLLIGAVIGVRVIVEIPAIGLIVLVGVAVGGMAWRRHLKRLPPEDDWARGIVLHSWLLATAVYAALNGGMYAFLRWCEAAV